MPQLSWLLGSRHTLLATTLVLGSFIAPLKQANAAEQGLQQAPVMEPPPTSPTLQANVFVPPPPGGMTLQAVGTETGTYDSNPLLLLHGAKPLWGSVTSPELIFNSKTPTANLNVDTLVNENLFNDSNFNSTDVHQKIGLNDQLERWGVGFTEQTDYNTTRTSELYPLGIGATSVNKGVRHLGLSFAPNVSYAPNATNKVSLAGNLVDSQYESSIFSNYVTATVTPTYSHNFDPQNSGTISLQAERYMTTSGPKVTDDTIGPQIGWNTIFNQRWSGNINVGLQEERQFGSGATQEGWSLQYTFSAGLNFKGQQDLLNFNATRANYALGNATQTLLTGFSVAETHALNQAFSVNGGASYQTATYQSSSNGNLDFIATGNAGLSYHATEHLDLTGTYQYRYEAVTGTSDNAQDHTFTIGVTYRPRAWTL